MSDRDWRDDVVDAANAAGLKASRDQPDAVLMAEARHLLVPGSQLDKLAAALADDLAGHAQEPVSRAACACLVRAAADLRGLLLTGYDGNEALNVLTAAAAKLEMRATP